MPRFTAMSGRARVRLWILIERRIYAGPKWDVKHRDLHVQKVKDGEWYNHVDHYLRSARQLGLDTPRGRQQLGKVLTSAVDILETAVEEFGDMPRPGRSSTAPLEEWGVPEPRSNP